MIMEARRISASASRIGWNARRRKAMSIGIRHARCLWASATARLLFASRNWFGILANHQQDPQSVMASRYSGASRERMRESKELC